MVNNWATSFSHYKNRGFRWFCWFSVISMCFCWFPVICRFSKIAFSKKSVQKLGFSIFSVLSLIFNFFFFSFAETLLKKNRGFSNFWGFLLLKEKKVGQKNDNWNLWILFSLFQKWPFRDTHLLFKKNSAWNLYFYSVSWVRVFLGQGVKKGKFWKPTKKRNNLTDNWKAIFWHFRAQRAPWPENRVFLVIFIDCILKIIFWFFLVHSLAQRSIRPLLTVTPPFPSRNRQGIVSWTFPVYLQRPWRNCRVVKPEGMSCHWNWTQYLYSLTTSSSIADSFHDAINERILSMNRTSSCNRW